MELSTDLQKLRQSDPDVDYIMKVFEEADRVHKDALVAMGYLTADNSSPVGSTSIAVSFESDVSAGATSFGRQ